MGRPPTENHCMERKCLEGCLNDKIDSQCNRREKQSRLSSFMEINLQWFGGISWKSTCHIFPCIGESIANII